MSETPEDHDPVASLPSTLVVVTDPKDLPIDLPDVAVISAREYLADRSLAARRNIRVVNLSRSYRYQKVGYYVSLLGHARGHRPIPSLATIQETKSATVLRLVSDELDDVIESSLTGVDDTTVQLSVYFGQEAHGRFPALVKALFGRLPLPLMRAVFTRSDKHGWTLSSCGPLTAGEVGEEDRPKLQRALEAFLRRRTKTKRRDVGRYDLAMLVDPAEAEPPSDAGAIAKFERAAEDEGFAVEVIGRDDYARVAEFDALFIRETTAVNHRTFRFAQRAEAQGLVVIDDPESILRCTNKVFLAEILDRYGVPAPRTIVAHRGNLDEVLASIGLPCVLKAPDSSFSSGVKKAATPDEFREHTQQMLRRSEMIVAQAFTPTDFDWRIGVIGRNPLYACKYFMARRHWQIIHRDGDDLEEGGTEAVPLDEVPPPVLDAAVRSANLMGDGLYGVDLKEIDGRAYVVEVNDNPSIDAGYEDELLGDGLYRGVMADFRRRLDERRKNRA
jgi:glutathione synthase/RimK-type ligase-like ATP-grasp enzyme